MHNTLRSALSLILLLPGTGSALAQTLSATQPNLITIVREEVKPGRAAEHTRSKSVAGSVRKGQIAELLPGHDLDDR